MTTRKEKFENERKKMLSQMGVENEVIEVEEEVVVENGSEEIKTHRMDFSDVPNKADRKALEAREQEIHDNFDKQIDLINNNPEEYRKQKTQKTVNNTNSTPIILHDLEYRLDGGLIMWIITIFFILPVGYNCFEDSAGRPFIARIIGSLFIFGAAWLMTRVIVLVITLIFKDFFKIT